LTSQQRPSACCFSLNPNGTSFFLNAQCTLVGKFQRVDFYLPVQRTLHAVNYRDDVISKLTTSSAMFFLTLHPKSHDMSASATTRLFCLPNVRSSSAAPNAPVSSNSSFGPSPETAHTRTCVPGPTELPMLLTMLMPLLLLLLLQLLLLLLLLLALLVLQLVLLIVRLLLLLLIISPLTLPLLVPLSLALSLQLNLPLSLSLLLSL
jgi:hypothetical protein